MDIRDTGAIFSRGLRSVFRASEVSKGMAEHDKVNILMVDDQPGKLLTYEAILSELNESLIQARSGKEALDHLLKHDVAVVLMDVSMPELDGFELADMIRQHPRFQNTAIIFISAVHLTDIDRLKAYERGAVDYIAVPIVPELLRAKVRVFADLHRKKRQLEILNHDLRTLSARLIAIQDEERRRIARDLHDSVGQILAAVQMNNATIEREVNHLGQTARSAVVENRMLVDEIVKSIRTISHLLHPPLLEELGIRSALGWYVDEFGRRSGINVKLECDPSIGRLNTDLETTLFRIVQESLGNVHRHSGSSTASVRLAISGGHLRLEISDNGSGIPSEKTRNGGVGLRSMRERVAQFDGGLHVSSSPTGTTVIAIIPCDQVTPAVK
jgi:signal transduction histidine kinase